MTQQARGFPAAGYRRSTAGGFRPPGQTPLPRRPVGAPPRVPIPPAMLPKPLPVPIQVHRIYPARLAGFGGPLALLAALYAADEAYRWWRMTQLARVVTDWNLVKTCSPTGDSAFWGQGNPSTCITGVILFDANAGAAMPPGAVLYGLFLRTGSYVSPGYGRYDQSRVYTKPTGAVQPPLQAPRVWDLDPVPEWAPLAQLHPMAMPPGVAWQPQPRHIPWKALPYLQPNPYLAEQRQQGYDLPPEPTFVPNEEPVPGGAPAPARQPLEFPEFVPLPLGHPQARPVPNAPGQPTRPRDVPRPRPEPGADPLVVTETVHPPGTSAGPSISIGPGGAGQLAPLAPPRRTPPRNGDRERKVKGAKGVIVAFPRGALLKRVNQITEAIEMVDCLFKALPKKTQFAAQKANWSEQRAALAERGQLAARSTRSPDGDTSVKLKSIPIPGLGSLEITAPFTRLNTPAVRNSDTNVLRPMNPSQRLATVAANLGDLDVSAALNCMVADQIEDAIYGRLGRLSAEAARRAGFSHGLALGPTF